MSTDNKAGRPSHQPTEKDRKTVQSMTSFGISQMDIAEVLGISDRTLRKYYAREIAIGATVANSAVAQTMFQIATTSANASAAVAAGKWWLACRAGWKPATTEMQDRASAPEATGKKAQQARDAETAGSGTEWGNDLVTPGMMN